MRGLLIAGALAAGSVLVVAPAPSYDPWAWLLWGREAASGTLSTTGGPAFKPLPVAVCALLAPLGEAAIWLWVLLVRAATMVAAWLAFRLGRRLAGGSLLAGGLAAAGVLLCGALPTYAATGAETPLVLALALAGAEAWRAGRPGAALACAAGCALLRVEAWPFVALLGVVAWRRGAIDRRLLVAMAVAVPAVWFLPEYLGSGDLLRSGERARVPNPGQPALAEVPALASLGDAAGLVLWPLLAGAGVLAVRGAAEARLWLAGGLAWVALVAAMAHAGFSGEARYALPGGALVAIAGAAGLARAVRSAPWPRPAAGLAAMAVVAAALPRLDDVAVLPEAQRHQWELAARLPDAIAAAGGRHAVLRCGTPYVGPLRGPLMAHRLEVAKRSVEPDADPRRPGVVFRSSLTGAAPAQPSVPAEFSRWAAVGPWTVYAACRRG